MADLGQMLPKKMVSQGYAFSLEKIYSHPQPVVAWHVKAPFAIETGGLSFTRI